MMMMTMKNKMTGAKDFHEWTRFFTRQVAKVEFKRFDDLYKALLVFFSDMKIIRN